LQDVIQRFEPLGSLGGIGILHRGDRIGRGGPADFAHFGFYAGMLSQILLGLLGRLLNRHLDFVGANTTIGGGVAIVVVVQSVCRYIAFILRFLEDFFVDISASHINSSLE
jgi:hypothetical protein